MLHYSWEPFSSDLLRRVARCKSQRSQAMKINHDDATEPAPLRVLSAATKNVIFWFCSPTAQVQQTLTNSQDFPRRLEIDPKSAFSSEAHGCPNHFGTVSHSWPDFHFVVFETQYACEMKEESLALKSRMPVHGTLHARQISEVIGTNHKVQIESEWYQSDTEYRWSKSHQLLQFVSCNVAMWHLQRWCLWTVMNCTTATNSEFLRDVFLQVDVRQQRSRYIFNLSGLLMSQLHQLTKEPVPRLHKSNPFIAGFHCSTIWSTAQHTRQTTQWKEIQWLRSKKLAEGPQ